MTGAGRCLARLPILMSFPPFSGNPWSGRRPLRPAWTHALAVLGLLAAVGYLYGPILGPGMMRTHETDALYIRPFEYLREIESGFWQPQLFQHALYGAGMAFPVFYPPVPLLLSAASIVAAAGDIVAGVHVSLFVSVVASALTMYACAAVLSRGRELVAFLCALVTVTATYHFAAINARGALAESWAMAWMPLIPMGFWLVLNGRRHAWILAAGTALMVLSHSVLTLWWIALTGLLFGGAALASRRWRALAVMAGQGVLGGALAAWFLIPQQVHLPLVHASDPAAVWATAEEVTGHRVEPWQFFSAREDAWYGASAIIGRDEMSFHLGAGQWTAVAGAAVLLLLSLRRRPRREAPARKLARGIGAGSLVLWGGCLAFMVSPAFLLRVLPAQFAYIQFPWRLLGAAPVLAGVALAAAAGAAGSVTQRVPGRLALAGACAAAFFGVPDFARTPLHDPAWTSHSLTDRYILDRSVLGFTAAGEYLPLSLPVEEVRREVRRRPDASSGITVNSWVRFGEAGYRLRVSSSGNGTVVLPLVWYPFWSAWKADGSPAVLRDREGYLEVPVGAGESEIHLRRIYTWAWFAGWAVTGSTVLVLFAHGRFFRRRFPRGGNGKKMLSID